MIDVKNYLKRNKKNCDIAVDYVVRADQIYGKVVPRFKEKLKRERPETYSKTYSQSLPASLENRLLHLFMDFLCINKMLFFI